MVEGGHDIEIGAATDDQAILIGRAWDPRGKFDERSPRGGASIHVVTHHHGGSRSGYGWVPLQRNGVRLSFVTVYEAYAKKNADR